MTGGAAGAPPELSIVVVNHNGAGCLPATLAALDEHTAAEGREVVVVDSASHDGSWREAEERPNVRLLRFEDNIGFCAGCNRGAQAASGRLVAFVNFDGIVEPAWDVALRALLDDPGVAVASGLLVTPDGTRLEAVGLEIAPNMATYGRLSGLGRDAAPAAPVDVAAASGALFMVRRADFLALGGFWETIWMYGEEADYCLRAAERGRVVVHPQSAIRHEVGHAAGAHQSAVRLYWPSRNRLLNAARHLPPGPMALSVALSAAFDVLTALQVRRGAAARLMARGWRDGLAGMPSARRDRTARQRRASARRLVSVADAVREQRRLGRASL
jgi:N-acetylglucosaminyl-diphospho-decaprenol L-rhamnosyltransferase